MKKIYLCSILLCIMLFPTLAAQAATFESPPYQGLKQIWGAQNLADLQKGEIAIPDSVINDFLASQLVNYPDIQAVTLTAKDNNLVSIKITTIKGKKYNLEGSFREFQHNKDHSFFKFQVQKKSRAGKSLTSWLFSRLSLSFINHIFGGVDTPEGTTVNIHGNTITVDFHETLKNSAAQSGLLYGPTICDALKISEVTSSAGILHVHTSVDTDYVLQTLGSQLVN